MLQDTKVLQSIQAQHTANILNRKKTIELRKNKPKLEVPFKVYLYCTKNKVLFLDEETYKTHKFPAIAGEKSFQGKVVGEYICDEIYTYTYSQEDPSPLQLFCGDFYEYNIPFEHIKQMCLTMEEIEDYGKGKTLYGWHISNLVIYDEPKNIGDFGVVCKDYDLDKKEVWESYCTDCANKHGISPCHYINEKWCIPVKTAPQSWMFTEGLYNKGTW